MEPSPQTITQLLIEWRSGDQAALDALMPIVHQELRKLAKHYLRGEREGHTLQSSALVNEVYIRLVDHKNINWQNRAHFFGVAAQAMRRVLVDYARARKSEKRGGDILRVSLADALNVAEEKALELIALDDALRDLEKMDARKSHIVELRYFGGLSVEETAEVVGVAPITVMREWNAAKAWLLRAISKGIEDK
jgi:RNA polymerase sigma-70 factor (ECF subfamily)